MSEKYPLEQIAFIKQKRLEEAEKVLKEKKRLLEIEEEKLRKAEEKRDLVKKHRIEKLEKFFTESSKGTSSDKIITHQSYIKKVVDEELKVEERKVQDHIKLVKKAEEEVQKARSDRLKKNQDVEKLKLHKDEWKKESYKEHLKKESLETDEMGSSTFSLKKRESNRGK
jgi:hypothetical protein